MTSTEIIEGQVVREHLERSLAVVPEQAQQVTLFGTSDPNAIIEKATAMANALARVIRDQGLYSKINGRDHVLVEGWTFLGTMLGVFPVVEWCRPLFDKQDDIYGWEARVEARNTAGQVVGAAEAMCTRSERSWASRDDYALRSMAQTRATSKAMRLPLSFVMTLAGFDATPADEMPPQERAVEARPAPATPKPVDYPWRDDLRVFMGNYDVTLRDVAKYLGSKSDTRDDVYGAIHGHLGLPSGDEWDGANVAEVAELCSAAADLKAGKGNTLAANNQLAREAREEDAGEAILNARPL